MSSMGLFQSMFVHVYGCRNEAKFDTLYFHCINYIWFIVLADVKKMRKSWENFIPCGVHRLSRRHVLKRSDLAQRYHVTLSNKNILHPMKFISAHDHEMKVHTLPKEDTFYQIRIHFIEYRDVIVWELACLENQKKFLFYQIEELIHRMKIYFCPILVHFDNHTRHVSVTERYQTGEHFATYKPLVNLID